MLDVFQDKRVLVAGDVMLDLYIRGEVSRISPEAPVPIVQKKSEFCRPGGAANVAASVAAIGCNVTLLGVIGPDKNGDTLQANLSQCSGLTAELLVESSINTITKTRIVDEAGHQLLRIDEDGSYDVFSRCSDRLFSKIRQHIQRHDVVVLSDYEKGTLPDHLIKKIISLCVTLKKICIIDPKKQDFSCYKHATLLTPNTHELERAVSRRLSCISNLLETGQQILRSLNIQYLLITRGPEGMLLITERDVKDFPAQRRTVADVSGAGDTVVATIAAALSAEWDIERACQLAIKAAGIAVSYPGTYVVQRAELEAAWSGVSLKITTLRDARRRIDGVRSAGGKIVFTNGCFDILHPGHLACLEYAKQLGDYLVVGLNSDESVRRLKGDSRPINPQNHRAALLAGLSCVDLVIIFDEDTPERLVEELLPDTMVKGADYAICEIAGSSIVQRNGGRVITFPLVPGHSTTELIRKLCDKHTSHL